MTVQLDGNGYNKSTDYPVITISAFSKSKEDAATYVKDLLRLFVPEEIWPWTTITIREEFGGSFAITVTTDFSGT